MTEPLKSRRIMSTRIRLKLKYAAALLVAAVIISIINHKHRDDIIFSNDCTLGNAHSNYNDPRTSASAVWQDTNYLGVRNQPFQPSASGLMLVAGILSPVTLCLSAVILVVFRIRVITITLCIAMAVANMGLLIGLLVGKVDPSTSAWLAIHPVSLFLFPWLLLSTFIERDLNEPHP